MNLSYPYFVVLCVVESQKQWMELCELAAKETDSAKLLALVQEINRILADKDMSLKAGNQAVTPANPES